MSFEDLLNDKVTLVKKDGTVVRSEIPAAVTSGKVITFAADLPIEVGDHFLRELPSGLAEDYIVVDPGFQTGFGGIESHFQSKVRRSEEPQASPQTIIANFHGPNSRLNVNSVDNSVNVVSGISAEQLADFIKQVRRSMAALPAQQQEAIAAPLAELEAEVASSAPSQSKIRSALESIRAITEGAVGNLVASGIGGLITKLLGGG